MGREEDAFMATRAEGQKGRAELSREVQRREDAKEKKFSAEEETKRLVEVCFLFFLKHLRTED